MLYATDFSRTPSGRSRRSRTSVTRRGRPRWSTSKRPKDPGLPEDANPEARLAELATQLENWGSETRTAVRQGDPADEILAAEDEYEPTSILVGSRGQHSRLRRLLLGSVSPNIVARADGNVMLIPPDRMA